MFPYFYHPAAKVVYLSLDFCLYIYSLIYSQIASGALPDDQVSEAPMCGFYWCRINGIM